MEEQLTVLIDSLDEKIKVLEEIREYNRQQEQAFTSETISLEDFDAAVERKDELIEKLLLLDSGFETMFARIKEELIANKAQYARRVKILQDKIAIVTDLSVEIQAQEARNKKLVEDFFSKSRNAIRQQRKSTKAAYQYYKTANGGNTPPSSTVDSKN